MQIGTPHRTAVSKSSPVLRQAKPQLFSLFVERGFGHQLSEQLPVESARACFLGCDWTANLASELLYAVIVELSKLLDLNLGAANGRDRIAAKAAENVADAPDGEADNKETHDKGHEALAEPSRGGFVNTAEHARLSRLTMMG